MTGLSEEAIKAAEVWQVMNGPSDKAIAAAVGVLKAKGCPSSYGNRAVEAAYPIIRADVLAEVVAMLRAKNWSGSGLSVAADIIECEFGGKS